MEEIWKDIIGYEGLYKVSNQGKVKRLYRNGDEKILKVGKATGSTPSNISACCRGIKKSVKGYKWMYVTELLTAHTI